MQGSPLDEMVQLLQSDRIQAPVHEIFGLRRVIYSMTEEIPSLLADLASQPQMPSPDFSSVVGISVDLKEEIANDDHVDDLNEGNEILSDPEEEDPDFIPRTDPPEVIYTCHSEEEKHAATIIQKAYRKVLKQRRLRNKTGREGQNRHYHYFHLCWKEVRAEKRRNDKYTQAFLGPLPHLLSSLDSAEFLAISKRREMKKRLVRGSKHESLDEISIIMNRIVYGLHLVSKH